MAKAKKSRKAKSGYALMRGTAPDVGGCSVGGVEYTADADGYVEVPEQYVEVLKAHGLEPVANDASDEAPTE